MRAGRGGGGRVPGERAAPAARPWNDGARARGRESGGVRRRASPRPAHPTPSSHPLGSTLFLPAPFFSRGGRAVARSPWREARGVTAPAQAQCFPRPSLHGCGAGMGGAVPGLTSSALRPAAKR